MPSIDEQASDFATKITEISRLFGGPNTNSFVSDVIHGGTEGSKWQIEIHNDGEGFSLNADEDGAFIMQAHWVCSNDGSGEWLKVEKSSFGVFLQSRPGRPLFRYDFDSGYKNRLPKAHIHFQADHPEMNPSQPMLDTVESLGHLGTGSPRAKRRSKHRKKPNLSDLHFPVGGTRFRPSLEDVLLMMVEEYGVTPFSGSAKEVSLELRGSILEWRKSQARAVIRDMPSLAIEYFASRGYQLTPDPTGQFIDRPEKLSES